MTEPREKTPLLVSLTTPLMWSLNNATTVLNAIGTLLIIALMVLICVDVVGRNVLYTSVPGVIELAELGIVSIVFLQIGDTLKAGKLMRSDGVIKVIARRVPRLAQFMNMLFDATGGVLFYFIAKGAYKRFTDAFEGGYYIGNLGEFTAPTWPMELTVSVGSALVCLLFATSTIRRFAVLTGLIPGKSNSEDDTEFGSSADL